MASYRQLIEKYLDSEYELDEVTSDVVLELLNEIQENAKKIDSQTTTIWLDLRNYRMAEEAKSNETV